MIEESKRSRICDQLLEADSATSFLETSFYILGEGRKSFSYAQFAKLAGFKARSYGRALILGLKPMSLNAYVQLVKLYGFGKEHSEYFKMLVAKSQPGFHDMEMPSEALQKKLDVLREKILRIEGKSSTENQDQVFSSRERFVVYSCVSAKEEGTAFKEIARLADIEPKVCRQILDELVQQDLLVKVFKNDAYRAPASLLIADKLGDKDFFRQAWIESAEVLLDRASVRMKNRENLFMNSYITVPRSELMNFRNELQGLVERFLDKWCEEPGDEPVELVLGATPLHDASVLDDG